MFRRSCLFVVLLAPCLSAPGRFCIWDRDTLADELRGLPDAYELIVGRWYRHGRPYYADRIARLPAHIEKNPTDLAAYDDLAVAYERVRDRKNAIRIMKSKRKAMGDKIDKEHLYRYHANLGTFYAHDGQFNEAATQIETAIRLNPAAHFGREKMQLLAIRFVAAARKDTSLWQKHNFLTFAGQHIKEHGWHSIAGDLGFTESARRPKQVDDATLTPWKDAYTGVAGMLRFGGLEGAELYRVLGDLFAIRRDLNLAWWSYQRAIERGHPAGDQLRKAIGGIERHWREAIKLDGPMGQLPNIEIFRAQRGKADRWLAAFLQAEQEALAAGKDPGQSEVLSSLLATADKAVPREAPPTGRRRR